MKQNIWKYLAGHNAPRIFRPREVHIILSENRLLTFDQPISETSWIRNAEPNIASRTVTILPKCTLDASCSEYYCVVRLGLLKSIVSFTKALYYIDDSHMSLLKCAVTWSYFFNLPCLHLVKRVSRSAHRSFTPIWSYACLLVKFCKLTAICFAFR